MKKLLRILLYVIGLLIVLLLFVFLYIQISGIPSYDKVAIEYNASSSPERLERGRVLVSTLCKGCHINRAEGNLSGGPMRDAPKEFGEIYAPNITSDKEYGIGSWTDAELMYLLRTGIKKDGKYAPPYMAKLPLMADEDMASIIAFLRSDNPLVNASSFPDKETEPSFLTKALSHSVFRPLEFPEGPIELPDTNDTREWGKYLVINFECFSCHSADFKSNDFQNPENSVGYFGGGNKPLNMEGQVMLTANLTPDKETGIGNWSKERFLRAVKSGKVDEGPSLRYPMNPYVHLSDKEVGAIYDYLQSIAPIKNKVERSE